MERSVDWNCRLLEDGAFDADRVMQALTDMQERFGLVRVCLRSDFFASRESVAAYQLRQTRYTEALRPYQSARLRIMLQPSVVLEEHLSELSALDRLTLTKKRILPLSLPLTEYDDWMDTEINHLLYKCHISPLFLSFELCMLLYPEEILEKLLRIPNALFQFNCKALQEASVCRTVRALLDRGAPVLLGSGINAPEKINGYDLPYYRACAARHLSRSDCDKLFACSRLFRFS